MSLATSDIHAAQFACGFLINECGGQWRQMMKQFQSNLINEFNVRAMLRISFEHNMHPYEASYCYWYIDVCVCERTLFFNFVFLFPLSEVILG